MGTRAKPYSDEIFALYGKILKGSSQFLWSLSCTSKE